MKFGLFYVLESPDKDYRRAYAEMLEQIEYAEHLGFNSVWLAEHHGSTYGSMPSPQVAAAAIAARTRWMRIGLAVSILPFDNPVRVAEDYAMVDVISNGRLDMGVGRGYQPSEYRMLGLQERQPISREYFQESLDVLIKAWTEERFSYQGKHLQFEDVETYPRPVQRPHPPIYVAAISPETFGLVADKGLKLTITPTLMALDELMPFALDAKKKLAASGQDPRTLDFPMNWQMHLAPTLEEAKERTKDAFGWYFDKVMSLVPHGANVPKSYEAYGKMADAYNEAGGFPIETLMDMGIVVLGTPQDAIAQIEKVRDGMGQQQIMCWMRVGGLEHYKVMDSIRLFAEEVMPHFHGRPDVVPQEVADAAAADGAGVASERAGVA